MSVRNQNWYNLQATRRYPIDDSATGISDAGEFIRDSILVDCQLRYPEELGQYAYVQGVTCSDSIVTVVFGVATDLDANDGTTIASVSLPKPIAQNVNHAVKAMVPGVAGWVAFGGGVLEPFNGRYSTPRQTRLLARNAKAYRALPVPSIGKVGLENSLQGLVKFSAAAPVVVAQETIHVNGDDVPALVFRLEATDPENNPLQTFLHACGQRPESNTCPKPPIETINGVRPDCNGNINFVFTGFDAYPYTECGGIDVISTTGLSEACNRTYAGTHRIAVDSCGNDDYDPLAGIPNVYESESLPDLGLPTQCITLPACFDFGNNGSTNFAAIDGLFVLESEIAPPSACVGGAALAPRTCYVAADTVGQNLALLQNCASDWAREHRFVTRLKFTNDGLQRNGGLFFNYDQTLVSGHVVKTFFVALIDGSNAKLKLLRWNGSSFVLEHAESFLATAGVWYSLDLRLDNTGSATAITAIAAAVDGTGATASFTVSLPSGSYGSPVGQVGLFSNRSYTYFNSLWVTSLPID